MFQKSVLNNVSQDERKIALRWAEYQKYLSKIDFIKTVKEEKYQDGFLKDIFENCLGYTLDSTNPDDFNLEREKKNETDGKKADAVIYVNSEVIGIIELKAQDTKNLDKIEAQAFNYHNSHSNSKYIIISNFDEIRLYIDKKTAYEKFSLFNLNYEEFKKLHLLLSHESIKDNIPQKLKDKSASFEQDISKNLYKDFSAFRTHLFENLVKNNSLDKALLLRLTQKLCDRIIFILFAEDRGLLTANTIKEIRERHQSDGFGDRSMYDYFKLYFDAINKGNERLNIPKYNGGLFAIDETLDSLIIDDNILDLEAQALSNYDFMSDVSVNILGHIFEQSLTDLEEINASINDTEFDNKQSKRKKDGVFYTPEYITKYIVDNTLGRLCNDKREELNLTELTAPKNPKKPTKKEQVTKDNLEEYLNWLLNIKILDPACGSGAFLNQALDFLISEHNALQRDLVVMGDLTAYYEVEKSILENNLYGVDINEDAVEIAKLSLWLKTASKGRELTKLADKIKCGNSLIDDKRIADNAFVWKEEFSEVFEQGGFDIVIGNPPYVNANELKKALSEEQYKYLKSNYRTAKGTVDLYIYFFEKGLKILKENCFLSYITPNRFLSASYGKALREYILENYTITSLIDFSDKNVFQDASTYPVITTLQNQKRKTYTLYTGMTYNENVVLDRTFSSAKLNILNDSILGFLLNDKLTITEKILFEAVPLISVGKINATSTAKEADDYSSLISEETNNSLKIINTGTIDPYQSLWGINELINQGDKFAKPYLKLDKNIVSSNRIKLYKSNKIIISKIGLSCESFYDKTGEYASVNTNCIHSFSEDFLPEYVLCWLNSKLYNYMFECFFDGLRMAGGYLLYSSPNLKNTYIKKISIEEQTIFIDISEKMTKLNISLQEAKQNFINELEHEKISKKLQNFEELDFDEFVREYKKAKKLKFTDKLEERNFKNDWKALFENDRKIALDLKSKIDITDKEIDKMVYTLYGLSEDEIRIVDNS